MIVAALVGCEFPRRGRSIWAEFFSLFQGLPTECCAPTGGWVRGCFQVAFVLLLLERRSPHPLHPYYQLQVLLIE